MFESLPPDETLVSLEMPLAECLDDYNNYKHGVRTGVRSCLGTNSVHTPQSLRTDMRTLGVFERIKLSISG